MTDEQIEKALRDADDIAIGEEVDCYDVYQYINRLKDEIAGLTGKCEALEQDNENLMHALEEAREELNEGIVCGLDMIKEIAKKYGVEVDG